MPLQQATVCSLHIARRHRYLPSASGSTPRPSHRAGGTGRSSCWCLARWVAVSRWAGCGQREVGARGREGGGGFGSGADVESCSIG